MTVEPKLPPTAPPWRVEAVSDAVRVVVGHGRGKVILARLRPPQLPEEETWANAHQMAASHELRAALEGMLREHALSCNCEEPRTKPCPEVVAARTALEKAAGKAPA